MVVLGIETSCDETSASVFKDGKIVSNQTYTQLIHSKYGGVVPEFASREHERIISLIINNALIKANVKISDIDCIGVTYGPGLMGALLVGVNFVKGLSIALGIPFIGINHLEGHIFANFIDYPNIKFPFLCLLVSGGHTQIWDVKNYQNYNLISTTRDDAAGEAFDKGAKILSLGYPGGPEIDKISKFGDPDKFKFTIPRIKSSEYDFSFSGLKTALLYKHNGMTKKEQELEKANLAASYQKAIISSLLNKIEKCIEDTKIKTVTIAGGVASNSYLRKKANELEDKYKIKFLFPSFEYCTDNGAMIAITASYYFKNKIFSNLELSPVPNLNIE